jgi:hypothetical protein
MGAGAYRSLVESQFFFLVRQLVRIAAAALFFKIFNLHDNVYRQRKLGTYT